MLSVQASEVIRRPPQYYLQFYEAWESFLVWGVWASGVGEEGSGAEKCFIVQASSVSLTFPSGRWDVLKSPKGEMKGTQEQQAQTVFFLGDTALLFLYCRIVLAIFIGNIRAQEEMMCGRHGRKNLTVGL